MTNYLIYFLLCFLIGSLPLGEVIARLKSGKSLIQPGTRNTLPPAAFFEILGIPVAITVCFLDALKGFITVYPMALWLIGPEPYSAWWAISLGGLLTVVGHCNSPFLGFKGGRGLSPVFGVMVTLLPVPAFLCLFLGLFLAFWGLSSKPGALSAAGAMPLLSIAWVVFIRPDHLDYLYVVAFMALWTMWEHREELKNYMGLKSGNSKPETAANDSDQNSEKPASE